MDDYTSVLEFWFGPADCCDSAIANRQDALWWGKSAATDAEIRRCFEALVLAAESGKLEAWKASADGWLALILVLDQFPRNIYRGTRDMYRFDDLAPGACRT
ncbi:MAG: DUF924 family protein [Wenzhouxiangellaceae bacterium]|nr:DUF924 family protein [Wenzhouxiangellaceae bacterium]